MSNRIHFVVMRPYRAHDSVVFNSIVIKSSLKSKSTCINSPKRTNASKFHAMGLRLFWLRQVIALDMCCGDDDGDGDDGDGDGGDGGRDAYGSCVAFCQ